MPVRAAGEAPAALVRARREENWRLLGVFLRQVRIWPIDLETARVYGQIYHEPREKGRVLSQVDIMISALARVGACVVLTTDRDFAAVSGLRTEDWTR